MLFFDPSAAGYFPAWSKGESVYTLVVARLVR
jgi:hypothetical protein